MRTQFFTLLYLIFSVYFSHAQIGWTQKTDYPGQAKSYATGFSIGNNGYFGTGVSYMYGTNDFWKWNSQTDIWTQIANVPGGGRTGAFSFAIGNKGYLGGGGNNDFFEYDPALNTWTQKANLAGQFSGVATFTINNKGYVVAASSLWEYDPTADTWTQKANFPGVARTYAVGFSIGDKGYVVGGQTNDWIGDFWCWDQSTNTWAQKPDFGGGPMSGLTAFSIGAKAYVGSGNYWEWDENRNTWVQVESLSDARQFAIGFTIGGKGYACAGGGPYAWWAYKKDLWEYNPCTALFVPSSTICVGTTLTLTAVGSTNYTWSTSSTNTSIVVTPSQTTLYTVSSTGINNCIKSFSATVTVNATPTLNVSGSSNIICSGKTVTFSASGAQHYTWTPWPWLADSVIIDMPMQNTSYTVTGSNDACPMDTKTISVSVLGSPTVYVTGMEQTLLCGQSTTLHANGADTYSWSTGVTSTSIISTPTANTIYTLTGSNSNGCYQTQEVYVFVYSCTGVESNSSAQDKKISVFPNPSQGHIVLTGAEQCNASVFNALGDKVLSFEVTQDRFDIDLSKETKGIYLIRIKKGNEDHCIRLVKQ
jgi:hypothetical protein